MPRPVNPKDSYMTQEDYDREPTQGIDSEASMTPPMLKAAAALLTAGMSPMMYLDSLIAGQQISSIPVQPRELQMLRALMLAEAARQSPQKS